AQKEMLIGRKVGKRKPALRIEIPRSHRLAAETGAADVNPVRRDENLLNAAVSRLRLSLTPIAPRRHAPVRGAVGVGPINARDLPRIQGEPRGQLRIVSPCL